MTLDEKLYKNPIKKYERLKDEFSQNYPNPQQDGVYDLQRIGNGLSIELAAYEAEDYRQKIYSRNSLAICAIALLAVVSIGIYAKNNFKDYRKIDTSIEQP